MEPARFAGEQAIVERSIRMQDGSGPVFAVQKQDGCNSPRLQEFQRLRSALAATPLTCSFGKSARLRRNQLQALIVRSRVEKENSGFDEKHSIRNRRSSMSSFRRR